MEAEKVFGNMKNRYGAQKYHFSQDFLHTDTPLVFQSLMPFLTTLSKIAKSFPPATDIYLRLHSLPSPGIIFLLSTCYHLPDQKTFGLFAYYITLPHLPFPEGKLNEAGLCCVPCRTIVPGAW